MANLPFFKFDAMDWIKGKVQLLTNEQKGIFIEVCARIWAENGRVKNDRFLARLISTENHVLLDALKCFFELGIIEENDGFLSVKFIKRQLSDAFEFAAKKRKAGRLGGRPKKQKNLIEKGERRNIKENSLTESKRKVSTRFERPTINDVAAYCQERGNSINASQFVDYYEAKGWKIGVNAMKDWRAAVRTWERRRDDNAPDRRDNWEAGL